MLKRAVLIAAILVPQLVWAADPGPSRRHHGPRRSARVVEQNHVVHCTTTNFLGFFSYSDCGQAFDPLASATN